MALSPRMGCLGNVTGVLWTKTLWGTHQDHLLDTIAVGTSASKHAIQHTEEDCTYRPPTSKVEAAFLNEIGATTSTYPNLWTNFLKGHDF